MEKDNNELVVIRFSELERMIDRSIEKHFNQPEEEIEDEKMSKHQAAKLIGVSLPTLSKLIKNGKFREYSLGRKKYLLRSEIIQALKKS